MERDQRKDRGLTRRDFLKTSGVGLAGAALLSQGGVLAQPGTRGPASVDIPLNTGWLFGGRYTEGSERPGFDDSGFERVTLPHCVTDLSWNGWQPESWEDTWIYRRRFDLPRRTSGMRVFLDFEGALTATTPTLNGERLEEHLGGYLPFDYEVTDLLEGRNNVLAVELNSRRLEVPPNVPDEMEIDYLEPGGIYRGVNLRVLPQTFISDVFAKPVDVLGENRRLEISCHLDSAAESDDPVTVEAELRDGGRVVARQTAAASSSEDVVELSMGGLGDIELWDVDSPKLYEVRVRLRERRGRGRGGRPVHEYRTRVGFREARFELDGFFLNGRRLQLFGLNRHQHYPYTGFAMPERVQRRDVEILKNELNCNMVRCSHYPQSRYFLDACDELGLLVWEEPPTWKPYKEGLWEDLFVRDVGDMVIRDRNRPSIAMWSVEINHAATPESESVALDLYSRTRDLAKSLDDSRPTTAGHNENLDRRAYDPDKFLQDVWGQNDYTTQADGSETLMEPVDGYPYLVSEAVGAIAASATYRRTDSVEDQQIHAVAHAVAHNKAASDDRYCGVLAWVALDYPSPRGGEKLYKNTKVNGILDIFREPKLGASIYQSQVSPEEKAVLEPAFYWDFGARSPQDGPPHATTGGGSMVCSNCERLSFYIDGKLVAEEEPDRRELYRHLPYPPFFADLKVEDGALRLPELRIDGYIGGERVISRRFSADTRGDRLLVKADDAEIEGDGIDATRVLFRAVDRYGAPRPFVEGDVTLEMQGPGEIVGDNPFGFEEAGGVGAVWVRGSRNGRPGVVRIRASHPTLGTQEEEVRVRRSRPVRLEDGTDRPIWTGWQSVGRRT